MVELEQVALVEQVELQLAPSISARIAPLFSALIQSMRSACSSSIDAFCEIMPRSPTMTMSCIPNWRRSLSISGIRVDGSAVLPSCTVTATGQPRRSVTRP